MNCRVCQTPDKDKPQIFKGEPYCCDRHRKIIAGDIEPTAEEVRGMSQDLYDELSKSGELDA